MPILEQGGNPTVSFSTDVLDASKAKPVPPTTPSESAPLVKNPGIVKRLLGNRITKNIFPHARDEKIPLYSHKFTKGILKHTTNLRGYVDEALTGAKHRFLAKSLDTNLHPDISIINTDGLQVTISVPVTQFTGLDSTPTRVREATENLLTTGKYSRRPQLPPGESRKKGQKTIPTPSAPNPDPKKIQLNPVNLVHTRNKQLDRDTHGYWPIAHITFQAGDESQSIKLLHDKKMADLPDETIGMLMPDLDLEINLRYISQTDRLLETSLLFPLGETSLQFDEDGALKEDPNKIGGLYFHPALRSLKDCANLISAQIFQATGKAATIDPRIIHQAMSMAPKADKDTEGIIGPYIDRMRYIGAVSRLLTQHPSEFAIGLTRIVNIVDEDGDEHPQAAALSTGIMANILGFEDAPHPHGSRLTYIGLISSLNQTLQDAHDEGGNPLPAYLEWAGNAKVVSMAVNRAREMPELYELVKKLGISNADQIAGEYRKTMSAAEFFGQTLTPQIIGLSALTLLKIENSQANIIGKEFLKIMGLLDTIDQIVAAGTQAYQDFLDGLLDKFLRDVKQLNPTKAGEAAEKAVIQVLKDKYEKATQDVIDVAVNPAKPELPDSSEHPLGADNS